MIMKKKSLAAAAALALIGSAALAQTQQGTTSAIPAPQTLNAIPPNSTTVSNYYRQNVYDPSDNKVGEVSDVLVDRDGKVTALIVTVGGIAGAGGKDVAVPFDSVRLATQNNHTWRLVMNSSADSLKGAPGYTYDRQSTTWKPASK
jgi:sporulation protein YlmC with PRC-barrel domain